MAGRSAYLAEYNPVSDCGLWEATMRILPLKIGQFIKKHEQGFICTGALLVFVTFVIKEGLAEHWRKTAEALDTAQYMHALHSAESENKVLISSLAEKIDERESKEKKRNRKYDELKPTLAPYQYLSRMAELDQSMETLKNTDMLTERMDDSKAQSARLENLGWIVRAARSELMYINILTEASYADPNASQPERWEYQSDTQFVVSATIPDAVRAKPDSLASRFYYDEIMMMHLNKDVYDVTKAILDKAELIRKGDEHCSKVAWRFAAVLFTIGWGLGLLGKLYKIPIGQAD
jgi:hypothetical protein